MLQVLVLVLVRVRVRVRVLARQVDRPQMLVHRQWVQRHRSMTQLLGKNSLRVCGQHAWPPVAAYPVQPSCICSQRTDFDLRSDFFSRACLQRKNTTNRHGVPVCVVGGNKQPTFV